MTMMLILLRLNLHKIHVDDDVLASNAAAAAAAVNTGNDNNDNDDNDTLSGVTDDDDGVTSDANVAATNVSLNTSRCFISTSVSCCINKL